MNITLEELISRDLDQLLKVIDLLPYPIDTKITLKYIAAMDFYESVQFDDYRNSFSFEKYSEKLYSPLLGTVKFTNGIVNYHQLKRYINAFISEVRCFSKTALEDLFFPADLFVMNLNDLKSVLDFQQLTKYEFLKKHQLNFIEDRAINKYLKSRANPNLPSFPVTSIFQWKPLSAYYFLPNIIFDSNQYLYQIDELENLFCIELANYIKNNEKKHLEYGDRNEYSGHFVNFILFNKYKEKLNYKLELMTPMNSLNYLEISCTQFSNYKPETRKEEIYNKLISIYNFPHKVPVKTINSLGKYFSEAIIIFVKQVDNLIKHTDELLRKKKNSAQIKLYQLNQDVLNVLPNIPSIYSTLFNTKQINSNYYKNSDKCLAWTNSSFTLDQWESKEGVSSLKYLLKFPLTKSELNIVQDHQYDLYCEYVEIQFNKTFKKNFEQILTKKDKILIAERDLSLINDMIRGQIDEKQDALIKSVFLIEDSLDRNKQFDNIIRNKCHSPNNYDIHSNECYADSNVIIKYKEYLIYFLSEDITIKPVHTNPSRKKNVKPEFTPIAYSYKKYIGQLSAITDTLNTLIKYEFVDKETSIIEFRKIFHNTYPEVPIVWIHGIESLAHFVKLLHDEYKLISDLGKTLKWKLTFQLFVDKERKPYDRYKFKDQKVPTKADLIEIAIAHMK